MEDLIGRVLATEKCPTTIDEFTFWTKPDLILNPFDIVKVEHESGSISFGVIQEIFHITDASSFLTNYISNDFGEVSAVSNTLRIGMNCVKAKVICNNKNIFIPLQNDRKVKLATAEEINYALGLKDIHNPLVCGYLQMYKGLSEGNKEREPVFLPVKMDSKFIIGPEGAHLNISGISGLAAKTSYAMFLLKAIQERSIQSEDESVAIILFNVKGKDLLAIDEENDFSDEENPSKVRNEVFETYKQLGLEPKPFRNVHYYYPNSNEKNGEWNTYLSQEECKKNIKAQKASKFVYIYEEDKENFDLMFSNIDDTTQTMDSIINYIQEGQGNFDNVEDWNDFLEKVHERTTPKSSANHDKEIPIASWRKFYRIVRKNIQNNGIFARKTQPEKKVIRLGEELTKIKKNEVKVIDIAKLSEDKQAFVFGDVVRRIYDLRFADSNDDTPSKIIIFIDELNKYASKEIPKNSPILQQVLDVAERGRSLGVILFAAEQFRSAIHDRVTGNCSTHAYGRTNSIELTKGDYKSIPEVFKNMMTRLEQGDYIIQNPLFRSLLKIKFPKPIYKQFK